MLSFVKFSMVINDKVIFLVFPKEVAWIVEFYQGFRSKKYLYFLTHLIIINSMKLFKSLHKKSQTALFYSVTPLGVFLKLLVN